MRHLSVCGLRRPPQRRDERRPRARLHASKRALPVIACALLLLVRGTFEVAPLAAASSPGPASTAPQQLVHSYPLGPQRLCCTGPSALRSAAGSPSRPTRSVARSTGGTGRRGRSPLIWIVVGAVGALLLMALAGAIYRRPRPRPAAQALIHETSEEALAHLSVESLSSAPTFVRHHWGTHQGSASSTAVRAAADRMELSDTGATELGGARSEQVEWARQCRIMASLALVCVTLAVTAVSVARIELKDGSATNGLEATSVRTVSDGPLTIRYKRPWHLASSPVPGAFALVAGTSTGAPISLTSSAVTLAAGPLKHSASVPGGVPPQLVGRYGHVGASTTTRIAGHDARRYDWTLPGGRQLVDFVLPTAQSDLTLICAGRAVADSSLASCDHLADAASLSGVTVVPPGPDAKLAAALSHDLAPVSVSLRGLLGLGARSLASRAATAGNVAHLERDAVSRLAGLASPARNRKALAALRSSLGAEGAAFAALGSAIARNDRSAYAAASLRVLAASNLLSGATGILIAQGFALPPFPALYLVSLAPAPARSAARTRVSAQGLAAAPVTQQAAAPATQQAAAPVSQQAAAPVTQQAAAAPNSSPPPSSNSTPAQTSTPPSPAVVVVPAGSTTTSPTATPPSTVVVVRAG